MEGSQDKERHEKEVEGLRRKRAFQAEETAKAQARRELVWVLIRLDPGEMGTVAEEIGAEVSRGQVKEGVPGPGDLSVLDFVQGYLLDSRRHI
jgi:hypothetical protein